MSSEMLFCVNRNNFYHEDAYDGHTYGFPPGEKVMVPLEAARHMFGVGESNLSAIMHRKGWAMRYNPESKTYEEDPDGVQKLKNFKWTKAQLVEQSADGAE